jgi:hypothetical protein
MLTLAVIATGDGALDSPRTPAPPARPETVVLKTTRNGRWLIRETANFRIYSLPGTAQTEQLPQVCERLREHLQQTWYGKSQPAWSPKCDIILHPNVGEYAQTLGPGSEQSSGCTSLKLDQGRVTSRRVDLRADALDWNSAALPHELTHVIVADRFSKRQLPRWVDEGMAILAEPEGKQARRYQELRKAIARRAIYQAADLVRMTDYPPAEHRDAFYGQSASLVGFLMEQDSPEKFLNFVELAMDQGYDPAVREVYGMASMAQLQAAWQPRLSIREQTPLLLTEHLRRITLSP